MVSALEFLPSLWRPLALVVLAVLAGAEKGTTTTVLYLDAIKDNCTGTCGVAGSSFNSESMKCVDKAGKNTTELPHYACDLADRTDDYKLIIHKSLSSQKLYKSLHLLNADLIDLMATAIADTMEFTSVKSILTETQSPVDEVFRSLTLTNATISDVNFAGLKILKLINSVARNVDLPNLQEIDIIQGSVVTKLTATILKPKSTFAGSTIEQLSLDVHGDAILNVSEMKIKAIKLLTVQANAWLGMRSTEVGKVDRLHIHTDNATMDRVTIAEIPDAGIQISGELRASNSEFKNVDQNGILIRQSGLVNFENVSVNSQFASYKLQCVDNSTLSIQQLYAAPKSSDVYFWFTVLVLPIIVLLMGAVIVFLVLKRNSSGRNISNDLKSSFNSKSLSTRSAANIYMPAALKEEISMASKTEKGETGVKESDTQIPPSISQCSSKSARVEHDSKSIFPPPPSNQSPATDEEDLVLYVDADSEPPPPPPPPPASENAFPPQKSSLHQTPKDSPSNTKPGPQKHLVPNFSVRKPTLPQKPPAPNPLLPSGPLKPLDQRSDGAHPPPPPVDSLPPSSHYAVRSKPKPPPRRGSEITTPPPSSVIFGQSGADKDELALYEDVAAEEPLYASDDDPNY